MKGIVLGLVGETLSREYGYGPWDPGWPAAAGAAGDAAGAGGDAAGADPSVDGEAAGHARGSAASACPDAPSDSLLCWFGRRAIPLLAEKYPSLFRKHATLRSFLESLADGEGPGAAAEGSAGVLARPAPDGRLLLSVPGGRGACALLKGVVAGAAEHYGERVRIEELKCGAGGGHRCVIGIGLEEAARAAAGFRAARPRARLA